MIKCPNCGSTAQMKRLGSSECDKVVIEFYVCGCGTKIERVSQRVEDRAWSPTGTLITRVKY